MGQELWREDDSVTQEPFIDVRGRAQAGVLSARRCGTAVARAGQRCELPLPCGVRCCS